MDTSGGTRTRGRKAQAEGLAPWGLRGPEHSWVYTGGGYIGQGQKEVACDGCETIVQTLF